METGETLSLASRRPGLSEQFATPPVPLAAPLNFITICNFFRVTWRLIDALIGDAQSLLKLLSSSSTTQVVARDTSRQ